MKFSVSGNKRLLCAAIGLGVLFLVRPPVAAGKTTENWGVFSVNAPCTIYSGAAYELSNHLGGGKYVEGEPMYDAFTQIQIKGFDTSLTGYDEDNFVFKGWFTMKGNMVGDCPGVNDATERITETVDITASQINSASTYLVKINGSDHYFHMIMPKFAHLYSITAEIAEEAKQGGTISISGEGKHGDKYEEGTKVTLSVGNLKDGFFVDRWEDEDGVQVSKEGVKSITVEVTGNAEYKVFLKGEFKVTFNSYGGGGIKEMNVKTGEVPDPVNDVAEMKGATFTGYYLTPSGEGEYPYWDSKGQWRGGVVPSSDPCTIPWSIYSNVTVYARYEEKPYTVKFDSNGGKGEGYKDKSVTYTQPYSLPDGEELSKDNYSFGGWAMSADADKAAYGGGAERTVEKDESHLVDGGTLTYYAFWKDMQRTVRFVAGSDEVTLSTNEMKKVAGEKYGELPTAVWDGNRYAFDGWWTEPQGGDPVNADSVVPDQDDISLYAHWTPSSYYIAFDGRGATGGTMAVEEFKFGQPQALTANGFEKTGCEFMGWATNQNALSKVDLADGAVVSNLLAAVKDETNMIYAVWKGNSYSVRFFGNGGTNEMSDQEFEYGVEQKLTANAFGRANYEFIGWAKDPSQAVAYTDEQEVSNLSAEEGAVVPLYAKWKWTGVEPTELSIAADCDKLALTTNEVGVTVETYTNGEERVGLNNQYVLMCPPRKADDDTSAACYLYLGEVDGKGTLSFYYKTTFTQGFGPSLNIFMRESSGSNITATVSEWTKFTYVKTDAETVQPNLFMTAPIQLGDEKVYIDYVTWTPDEETEQTVGVTYRLNDGTSAPADIHDNVTRVAGVPIGELPVLESEEGKYFAGWMTEPAGGKLIGSDWIIPAADVQLYAKWSSEKHPVPGPGDEAKIVSAGVSQGGSAFILEFANKPEFAYELWTNSDFSVESGWGLMETTNSADATIILKPAILPGWSRLFYRLETKQRQD